MIDLSTLNDPKTKRCCPARCRKTISVMDAAVTQLLTSITSALSNQSIEMEDKTNEILTSSCVPIERRITAIEEQIQSLYKPIQNSILGQYANAIIATERLLNSPADRTTIEESLSTTDDVQPIPLTQPQPQTRATPDRSATAANDNESRQTTPTLSRSSSEKSTPALSRLAPSPNKPAGEKSDQECVYIDLCEGFWFAWQTWYKYWDWDKWLPRVERAYQVLVQVFPELNVELTKFKEDTVDKQMDKKESTGQVNDAMSSYYDPTPEPASELEE